MKKAHFERNFPFQLKMQWNPVNTDTKGTGQIVRTNGVSVLSGVSEAKGKESERVKHRKSRY